jgi:hypothetical protein
MNTQSRNRSWTNPWQRLMLALLAFLVTASVPAWADPDEEVEGPFQPLFKENPELKPVPLIPAEGYFQVGTSLTASPEYGYRWDLWALHPDGKPIGRMAASGRIASRRLIDRETGETIGVIDCTHAPSSITIINRYGQQINIDLCMAYGDPVEVKTPYPLYRVKSRGNRDEPTEVDPNPIGWVDELRSLLLDESNKPVARTETVRLSEIGARSHLHFVLFASRSLTTDLLTRPPSNDLLRRIEERAALIAPTSDLPTKLLRVDLAARWLQAGAALITDKSASAMLPAERIINVRAALARASLNELNYLWKDPSRRLLWDSLAATHPFYRLYAEAVDLAQLGDDPEVLDHTLRLLKAVWIRGGRQQIKVQRQGAFEDWMRTGLLDALQIQSVRTPESALAMLSDYKVVQPSTLVRARAIGEPPVVRAYPPGILRAANQASAMDRAIFLATALQRGGRDVTLWSVSNEKIVDDATKTKVQEPLIVFAKEEGKPEILVIGADAVLRPLKGKAIAPGYYEFATLAELQPLLVRSAQFQVSMVGVLEAQSSLATWINSIQSALAAVRPDDPIIASILLENTIVDPWERYNQSASESVATLSQGRFVSMMRDHKMTLVVERVKDGKIVSTSTVQSIDNRAADEILAKHEATLGRCLHMLPPKFEDGLRIVKLRSEPILELLPSAIIEEGRIKIDTRERRVIGRAGPVELMLAAPFFPEAYHEMMHRWGNSRRDKFTVGDWEGNLVEVFNEISWQKPDKRTGWDRVIGEIGWRKEGGRGWDHLHDVFKIEDFWWDYGATNEREDFAVIGQFYGTLSGPTRERVRAELKKGNFVPAAKYLYFKMIAFLDADGRSLEIDVDAADKPFTIFEFEQGVRALEKKGPLDHEQERLRDLVKRIKALNGKLREKKTAG